MTSLAYVLAVVSYFGFLAATGETILTVKLLKAMLGDFSINRRLTNAE